MVPVVDTRSLPTLELSVVAAGTRENSMSKITYRDAGVDLETYRESMSRLPTLMKRTHCPRVLPWKNGFAGLFTLDFSGGLFSRNYKDPVLVSCTDGVGTKLKVAQMAGRHDTVGIDLVAMCVNDALCCGAEPLFFLDYVALAEDDPQLLEDIVGGISRGCLQSDMALVGGETAIMPDLYQVGDYDLAGFCVGIVERSRILDGSSLAPGDVVIGIASSGIHSNGYSLVRKIVFEHAGLTISDEAKGCDGTVGDVLLQPTQLYVRALREVLNHYKVKSVVHGIAHITGGGLHENVARIFTPQIDAEIVRDSWPVPPVFEWLQRLGDVEADEMFRVFNMGIGMVVVVSEYYADSVQQQLASHGLESWPIGRIVQGTGECRWA